MEPTLIGPIGTAFSAGVAALAFLRTQHVRRQDIRREGEIREDNTRRERLKEARAAWYEYLKLAFINPRFSSGFDWPPTDRDSGEQYEWYVTSLLFSGEGILEAAPDDPYWRKTLETQFNHHRAYLMSSDFDLYKSGYSPSLQKLLENWKANLGRRGSVGA